MKKFTAALAVTVFFFMLFVLAQTTMAKGGTMNGDHVKWEWWQDTDEIIDGYFLKTGSGLVNAWIYGHPQWGDTRYQFKPLSKFTNATAYGCDEGYLHENTYWSPNNLRDGGYILDGLNTYNEIFDSDTEHYLLCVYPME